MGGVGDECMIYVNNPPVQYSSDLLTSAVRWFEQLFAIYRTTNYQEGNLNDFLAHNFKQPRIIYICNYCLNSVLNIGQCIVTIHWFLFEMRYYLFVTQI